MKKLLTLTLVLVFLLCLAACVQESQSISSASVLPYEPTAEASEFGSAEDWLVAELKNMTALYPDGFPTDVYDGDYTNTLTITLEQGKAALIFEGSGPVTRLYSGMLKQGKSSELWDETIETMGVGGSDNISGLTVEEVEFLGHRALMFSFDTERDGKPHRFTGLRFSDDAYNYDLKYFAVTEVYDTYFPLYEQMLAELTMEV